MLKSAECVIVVTQSLIAVKAIFQNIFVVALMVVSLTTATVKKHSKLLLAYLPLFNLNEMFRCLFLLMTSAYQQKNVNVRLKTLVIFSEKSHSLLMNSSHQTKKIVTLVMSKFLTQKVLAVAVSKQKESLCLKT
jgi:hypothetical protein